VSSFIQVKVVGRDMPTFLRIDSITQIEWFMRGEGQPSWSYLTIDGRAADEGVTIEEAPPVFVARLNRVGGGDTHGS
jgi:hypothetical protein